MLQEVHCSENTNSMWSAEWGYKGTGTGLWSERMCLLISETFPPKNVLIKRLQTPKHHGRAKGEEEYERRYEPKEEERVRLTD